MARGAPARAEVIAGYAREIVGILPRGRVLVGIDGLDGAGKTTFARDLSAALVAGGTASAVLSLDGFHHPRDVREQPPDDARTWYAQAYDYPALRRLAVEPFRRGEAVVLEHRSRIDDAVLADPPRFEPGDRSVLVVEGVYLHRPLVVGLWHTSAWLDVPVEVALARYSSRDGTDPDPAAAINRKYLGAEELYLAEADPYRRADATFDLTDPAHPRRVFRDSC